MLYDAGDEERAVVGQGSSGAEFFEGGEDGFEGAGGVAVAGGGGIYNSGGTLTLQNCSLFGNSVFTRSENGSSAISNGGAIENFDGIVRMRNCTFRANSTFASSGSGMTGFPDASGERSPTSAPPRATPA